MRSRESTTAQRPRRRTGAALPLTLFIIVIVTMLSAGAFSMIGSERRVTDDHKAQLDAYIMARRGLEQFIGNRAGLGFTSTPPAAVESTTIAVRGGYVDVVMRVVRAPVGTTTEGLYVIRARGVKTSDGTQIGAVIGERTIAEYARFQIAELDVHSAWTAMAGLVKNGGSGVISGVDACGSAPSVAGVAAPTVPGYTQLGTGASAAAGSPPILDMGTTAETVNTVTVDWNAIVNGTTFQPDIAYPGGSWPTSAHWADSNFWPVIRVDGDFNLPADGRGILIVTGNLVLGGSQSWHGIVLVGGTIVSNGLSTVEGAIISGLNTELGISVPASDLGNGTKFIRYNSCDVANALKPLTGLVPYRNAGMDNWPIY